MLVVAGSIGPKYVVAGSIGQKDLTIVECDPAKYVEEGTGRAQVLNSDLASV